MDSFRFFGQIPPSKSMMNRALIIQSYSEKYEVFGHSEAEDVLFLKKALGKIVDGKEFYLGDGGTTLRFFAMRASRKRGSFHLRGGRRLMTRPQQAIRDILQQLGVRIDQEGDSFLIQSHGWKNPNKPLVIPTGQSSQFLSSVILNSWDLPFDLVIEWKGGVVSEPYFQMTLAMCKQAGMDCQVEANQLIIPKNQRPRAFCFRCEPDFSSMFSIAAMAALNGEALFLNVPPQSLQPDFRFFEILRQMGVGVSRQGHNVQIKKNSILQAIEVDIAGSPDLAPVLAVLCAFAQGTSTLRGASHLKHKESDRIASTSGLLSQMGVETKALEDGLVIFGRPKMSPREFVFDPDSDHRLAMAAALLVSTGWNVRIRHSDVVKKSFPEFWRACRFGPHLVVGHRGVGKTTFLKRCQVDLAIDLDQELEKENQQSVFQLMRDRGEEVFRKMEVAVAQRVLDEAPAKAWIASGAGLRLDEVHPTGDVLWLRRDSDRDGRVFLDRPRLDPQSDPLSEYKERAKRREPLYARWSHRQYTVPEGLNDRHPIEDKILNFDLQGTGGIMTVLPDHRDEILQYGADYYELRDDLLELDEIRAHFGRLDDSQVLYSIRKSKVLPLEVQQGACLIDWAVEAGYPSREEIMELQNRLILSSHGSLQDALLDFRLFRQQPVHLKLSPLIESFDELRAGHAWWLEDPDNRSFLPRSANGRWGWYRLWMKGKQKINFWRLGTGSAFDQPTLWHWLATPARPQSFAAVLGSPVHHSWTPVEHAVYFAKLNMPIWAIEVREPEWSKALPFLSDLGLRHAAVTAPLKGRAFRDSLPSERAKRFLSSNTLFWDEKQKVWLSDNTDVKGLMEAAQDLPKESVAFWGGGGTLRVLAEVFPNSSAFSAQTGERREGSRQLPSGGPQVVIWAAPRGAGVWPPVDWKPQIVFDLNYREDSAGREYALKVGAKYYSGEKMFRCQAEEQRVFWSQQLR